MDKLNLLGKLDLYLSPALIKRGGEADFVVGTVTLHVDIADSDGLAGVFTALSRARHISSRKCGHLRLAMFLGVFSKGYRQFRHVPFAENSLVVGGAGPLVKLILQIGCGWESTE